MILSDWSTRKPRDFLISIITYIWFALFRIVTGKKKKLWGKTSLVPWNSKEVDSHQELSCYLLVRTTFSKRKYIQVYRQPEAQTVTNATTCTLLLQKLLLFSQKATTFKRHDTIKTKGNKERNHGRTSNIFQIIYSISGAWCLNDKLDSLNDKLFYIFNFTGPHFKVKVISGLTKRKIMMKKWKSLQFDISFKIYANLIFVHYTLLTSVSNWKEYLSLPTISLWRQIPIARVELSTRRILNLYDEFCSFFLIIAFTFFRGFWPYLIKMLFLLKIWFTNSVFHLKNIHSL